MKKMLISLLLLALLAGLAASVLAAPQQYSLDWWTVDSGGGTSQGGGFTLSGAIGQPDTGSLQGGGYVLQGGFWSGTPLEQIFKFMLPHVLLQVE